MSDHEPLFGEKGKLVDRGPRVLDDGGIGRLVEYVDESGRRRMCFQRWGGPVRGWRTWPKAGLGVVDDSRGARAEDLRKWHLTDKDIVPPNTVSGSLPPDEELRQHRMTDEEIAEARKLYGPTASK
jgi:hypothetical protein